MEQKQVNNIYKIKNTEVDYYEIFGRKYQFDEIFKVMVDITEEEFTNPREYDAKMAMFPEGRMPKIMTIEAIYSGIKKGTLKNAQFPQVKGYNCYARLEDFKISKGIYNPKALIFLADELNELMTSDDYKSVDAVKQAFGSIARLGRAAGVHLALAAQRASGSTISSDLKNNIQQSVLLGGFDSGASTLMFEKDISNLAKPEIKGRAFMQSGNEILEFQSYYTQPENDWEFDESQKLSYDNPVFLELKKRRKEVPDDTGFVEQFPYENTSIENQLNEEEDIADLAEKEINEEPRKPRFRKKSQIMDEIKEESVKVVEDKKEDENTEELPIIKDTQDINVVKKENVETIYNENNIEYNINNSDSSDTEQFFKTVITTEPKNKKKIKLNISGGNK